MIIASGVNFYSSTRPLNGGSEFSSYEIELQNQVTQNDVILWITNSKIFVDILLSSY